MVRKRRIGQSVLNISARLGPSQSILGSPDALRKAEWQRDAAGAVGVFALGQRVPAQQEAGNRQRQGGHNSVMSGQGTVAQRFNGGIERMVPAALLSFQVLRSARMAKRSGSARPNRVPGTTDDPLNARNLIVDIRDWNRPSCVR